MMSVHSLVFFGGIALASGPLGWLATQSGPRLALAIAAGLTIVASLAYVAVARLLPAARPEEAPAAAPEVVGGGVATAGTAEEA